MLPHQFQSIRPEHATNGRADGWPPVEWVTSPTSAADFAVDAVLRAVPLPEGFMTRLGTLAFRMSDDSSESVDWLGC